MLSFKMRLITYLQGTLEDIRFLPGACLGSSVEVVQSSILLIRVHLPQGSHCVVFCRKVANLFRNYRDKVTDMTLSKTLQQTLVSTGSFLLSSRSAIASLGGWMILGSLAIETKWKRAQVKEALDAFEIQKNALERVSLPQGTSVYLNLYIAAAAEPQGSRVLLI